MDIEAWFETKPCELVNAIALEKRYIWHAIHGKKALNFDRQGYIIKDILSMSRKVKEGRNDKPTVTEDAKGKTGTNGGTNGKKTRWANIDIRSKDHKQAIRELSGNVDFVLDTLVELVDDGYDLHVKRTDEGSTVTAMLFCRSGVQCADAAGLSASAPDAWLALSSLIYKHTTVRDGKWFQDDESDADDNWR